MSQQWIWCAGVCESALNIKAHLFTDCRHTHTQVTTPENKRVYTTSISNIRPWEEPEIACVCEETSFHFCCFTTYRQTVFRVQRSDSHPDNVHVCVCVCIYPDLLCNYSWISDQLRISCQMSNKSEPTLSVCSMTKITGWMMNSALTQCKNTSGSGSLNFLFWCNTWVMMDICQNTPKMIIHHWYENHNHKIWA